MRITFVALGWEQLGVSLLSAIAKERGHEVNLAFSVSLFNDRSHLNISRLAHFFDDRTDVISAIKRQRPHVLAFSALTANYQWMLSIAREAKEFFPGIKTIFGGVHPSAVPDLVILRPEVDCICIGEGDVSFPFILEAIEEKRHDVVIPNIGHKLFNGKTIRGPQQGFIRDLDSLPVFDKTIWEEHISIGDSYITMTARGCPYRCAFCFNSFFAKLPGGKPGGYIRQRSVDHVMHELRIAKKRYKINMIEFFDDVFTLDKKWLKKFLDIYKREIKVPFQCFTHVNYVDEEIGQWLSEAGCFSTQIGVQSMDDEYKRKIVKRSEKATEIERAVQIMRKYKIKAKIDHMFGLPGEPMEAQEKAREFYARRPPYSIQTYWLSYFPGTELIRNGLEEGLIGKEDVDRINEGLDCNIYSNSNANIDRKKIKTYYVYQIIFKLIPNLPKFLRCKLKLKLLEWLPVNACVCISFMADVFIGLMKLSPDHILYARHYFYHIKKFFLRKAGRKVSPATKLLDSRFFRFRAPERVNMGQGMPVSE